MKYEVKDQTNLVKTLHFEAVKVLVNSNDQAQARKNVDDLWQIELGGTATIQGYQIKRVR